MKILDGAVAYGLLNNANLPLFQRWNIYHERPFKRNLKEVRKKKKNCKKSIKRIAPFEKIKYERKLKTEK